MSENGNQSREWNSRFWLTLWLPQELRLAPNIWKFVSRLVEKLKSLCLIFSLPYYMWYLKHVCNQQCNRWFKMLSPA